jgi:AraC-like DNA-binding protein
VRSSITFGDTQVSVIDVPAAGSSARTIQRSTTASVDILFPLDVPLVVHSDARDRVVRPNEALLLSDRKKYAVYASQPSAALTAVIPTAAIEEYAALTAETDVIHDSAVLAPAKRFLLGVMENDGELERLSAYFIEKLVVEMVASLILESHGAGNLARPSLDTIDRAMAHIAAYRADQALSPTSLAQSMNLSTRQLQRMFSSIGSTPSREIRRQRAELALSMLRNPAFRVLNVSQIAMHSGFADGPELRRAFDALGYQMPREIRHAVS